MCITSDILIQTDHRYWKGDSTQWPFCFSTMGYILGVNVQEKEWRAACTNCTGSPIWRHVCKRAGYWECWSTCCCTANNAHALIWFLFTLATENAVLPPYIWLIISHLLNLNLSSGSPNQLITASPPTHLNQAPPEVLKILEDEHSWKFNILELERVTAHRSVVGVQCG